ncbi:MAG: flagellar hook-associated protein FlgK [Zetaproteobacteria bacterium CG12_big_fil_rev_8_21_14_0_65_55_1124]|nr:MAG: flagellar hook-associated protein FlgK [Zetaproteobacteria bacterium CG1_02_55_237]PIS18661.1 MAG: flagellar hook-associated protein FlgK [Zetaproteobacteria bacterium CG08_land_8_20_14_0_20_55_17]PIW43266.1 MAG: flagellar hook-associated protein FlgK [Zetaproteobacteria bacterium CG12_big_fil_rev_8_21_14_0_65_55_1124]PIY53396.1 MAG: flagellar hook-associated protein FlgK [Zetaproteobacteria bacterium CG_4_10_14_0_8_um_filter_55_43]PIZ38701.1 MAG: flagellar hook-associated protein FlgK 
MILRNLNVAASSLLTQQQAMDVISQNIANVNTPGYSRQTAQLASAVPDRIAGRDFGNGVNVSSIIRSIDPILAQSQMANNSLTSLAQTLQQGLANVEASFGNLDVPGLTTTLDDFFVAQQQLANTPEDPISRLNVQTRAQDIAIRVSGMRQQLVDGQTAADQEISPLITQTNNLLDQIAALNKRILVNESSAQLSNNANDLRDQRDTAVMELSKLIPLQKVATNNGGLILQTPGGDLLVQNDTVRHLKLGPAIGSSFGNVEFTDSGLPAQGLEQGGKLGGLISLRDNQVASYVQNLDSMAANLIFAVNQLHTGGTGSTVVTQYTAAQPSSNPATAVNVDANIPFASKIVNGSFTLHVLDGPPLTNPGGTAINITAGTTTLNQIATAISAVAGVTASVNASGQLVVDGGANRIAFTNDTSNFLAAYEINAFFHGSSAADFAVDSAVLNDAGRIASAAANATTSDIAPADNSVALAILGLRDKAVSIDGSTAASPVQRAANLASTYGLDVAAANQQLSYRQAEASSLASQRASISGVNMDEELVKMMQFQRAYEAAAKVIQTSNQMLDSLMGLIR